MAAQAAVLPTNGRIFPFRKAVKRNAKLRLAVSGPGGSGKTYTLLTLATELGGRIALVDTEHGSASKYADLFEFDVLELKSYDPGILPELIAEAAAQGYTTLIVDSLSHFWNGAGGELEQVERITARAKSNNSWAAWREVSPKHNRMIDAIHAAPMHILASMRVKTEWIVDRDEKTGKTSPRKVGLQPIMRDGIDYEFDICGEMDQENTLIITKSRCPQVSGGLFPKPGRELAAILNLWLGFAPEDPPEIEAIWRQMSSREGVCAEFEKLRMTLEQLLGPEASEAEYEQALGAHGVREASEFKSSRPARLCARDLFLRIAELAGDGREGEEREEVDDAN